MNADRRKAIGAIVTKLESIDMEALKSEIESLKDEEQEYLDNIPENLQYSERAQTAQFAVDALEEAAQNMSRLVEKLNEAVE